MEIQPWLWKNHTVWLVREVLLVGDKKEKCMLAEANCNARCPSQLKTEIGGIHSELGQIKGKHTQT